MLPGNDEQEDVENDDDEDEGDEEDENGDGDDEEEEEEEEDEEGFAEEHDMTSVPSETLQTCFSAPPTATRNSPGAKWLINLHEGELSLREAASPPSSARTAPSWRPPSWRR